jgi:hypothetical protein
VPQAASSRKSVGNGRQRARRIMGDLSSASGVERTAL